MGTISTIRCSSRRCLGVDGTDEMIVTGAQPVGAKSLGAVQVTGVDAKDAARVGPPVADQHEKEKGVQPKRGEPLPIVFVRDGMPTDTRPSDLRHQRAARRYKEDGGEYKTTR
jgi:hypothetical protein